MSTVPHNLQRVLELEVPIVVRLAERRMTVRDVIRLVPGSIIELHKNSECELDLLVNGKAIGTGAAVKVGENFGIRLSFLGDLNSRIEAATSTAQGASIEDQAAAAMAEQLLSGQL